MPDQAAPSQGTREKAYYPEHPREVNLTSLTRLASHHGKGMLDWKGQMVAMHYFRSISRLKIYSYPHLGIPTEL